MKTKRISSKLNLNKTTVANLMGVKAGGYTDTIGWTDDVEACGGYTQLADTCTRTDKLCTGLDCIRP